MKMSVTMRAEIDLKPEYYEKEGITDEEMLAEERKNVKTLGTEYAYMILDREEEVEITLEALQGG